MTKIPLNVFTNVFRAGRITRSERLEDTLLFSYSEDCRPENAVSLTMPVRSDQYDAMSGLLPIFEMNLPEGELRERIAQRISEFVSPGSLAHAREQFALIVAYSCAIENGDAHRKNFSVIYDTPESEVRFAPAYDLLSTTPYIPRDTLALTLNGTKQFPTAKELIKFIRFVTARSERGAVEILDRVGHGVTFAIQEAHRFAREHHDTHAFADRLVATLTRGLQRSCTRGGC